jgi:hypothetical protein
MGVPILMKLYQLQRLFSIERDDKIIYLLLINLGIFNEAVYVQKAGLIKR